MRKTDPIQPRCVRTNDAARYLGMSPWKVRHLISDGKLSIISDGDGPFRLDVRDLDKYIETHRQIND
jgi:excisionase family DNA binding protein